VGGHLQGMRCLRNPRWCVKQRTVGWKFLQQGEPVIGRSVSPHVLRHSFAPRLRENGAPRELIQEALGHASINTTMQYAHISTAKRKAELAKFLDGLGEKGA
jgi:site-specific recombinase XerD